MAKTLQELTENKRILLVGNSVEILQYNLKDKIESYDTVVRFGQGYPRKENEDRIGSRTDIWITGYLRQNFSRFFKDSLKLHNRCRIHMDRPAKAGDPEFEHITMFSDKEILEINKELGVVEHEALGWRPSAGFWAILFFIRKCNYKSLTLIGFDFFSKSLPFKTGEDHPSSWHMPISTVKVNPHNPKEKELVLEMRDKGIIEWIILSDLKKEFLNLT